MGQLREKTNFYNDVVEYGPIGENDLIEILNKSPKVKEVLNVGEDKDFQIYDIDILAFNNIDGINKQIELNEIVFNLHYGIKSNEYITYEVKTDTYGIVSRNIVYEQLSNGNIGCLAKTKADYLYYVFLDEKKITERFLMNVKTLNKWLMKHYSDINKVSYLQSRYMSRGQDNTAILLINIDKLIEDKIAIKINNG